MANNFNPSCAPIWGFPAHMTVADFEQPYTSPATIFTVSSDTTSAALTTGARGVKLDATFSTAGATCSVDLLLSGSPDTTVTTWTGVSAGQPLFAGNEERVDLDGAAFKVRVYNISAGSVTVSVTNLY